MAERDSKGRFLPGTTGNPKGRPKDTPPAEDIIEAALPEVIMRLIDLMHSENETISLQAAIALRDWHAMAHKLQIPAANLTSISMTYGEQTPTITVKNGDFLPTIKV